MPASDIKYFLCYASDDVEFALNLADKLRNHNANVWMDKLDLRGGQLWDDGIEKALEECQGMILVLSPSSVASQNVKDEVSYAFDERMTIVPVLYKKCKIPFRIRRIHYVDFTDNYEHGFAVLLRSLNAKQVEDTLVVDEKGDDAGQLKNTIDKYHKLRQIKQTVPPKIKKTLWVILGISIISTSVWYWGIPDWNTTFEKITLRKTLSEADHLQNGVGNYDARMLGGDFSQSNILQKFIEDVSEKHDININYLYGVFSNVKSRRIIHEAYERNIEPRWIDYRDIFINPDRIEHGKTFRENHIDALIRAEQIYGIPAEYIVAIIGMETRWGKNTGNHKILESLVNSVHSAPFNEKFFLNSIEEYLLFTQSEKIDPLLPKGSYAGAMGYGQFLPGTFRKYAVDFDGDGKKNPWSIDDTIGTIANYLNKHDWHRREIVAAPAEVFSSEANTTAGGLETPYTLDSLKERGVRPISQEASTYSGEVYFINLEANDNTSETWIGFNNFYVITRFNRSIYYAMVVHQLAEKLDNE